MSADPMYRLWRQAGLQSPRKRPRRPVAASRPPPTPPEAVNRAWTYDFVFDACATGQALGCLTIVDDWTPKCHAIDVAGSIRPLRVVEVLSRLIGVHGAPGYLRPDNGPEFVSLAIVESLVAQGIDTTLIDPGKPWQNSTDESLNGKFPDECLNVEWFRTLPEALDVIDQWRRHYKEVRPHSSLGYLTPKEFNTKNELIGTSTSTQGAVVQ